jgi:4-amino-4-deoxy-L-arabinose transferase-like glycosyltransferase
VRNGRPLLILLALAILLFFLGLGTLGLTDRDEGRNAEAAREMVETGDWVSPTFNYEPRFAKPAFVYWLMSGAYRLFGVSEFTARLPSALCGVALILLQCAFLTRLRGPLPGLLGGLMLLLNVEIVAIGRLALTDSALILFTTLSLFGFWLGLHGSASLTTGGSTVRQGSPLAGRTAGGKDREQHWMWLFYVGMALGMLTKGPVGIVVPLLAIIPYLTLARRWGQFWHRGFPLAGSVLLLLLALPWYLAMFAIHGASYGSSAQADTVGRFLKAMQGHGGTLFFYIPILLFGFFPWSGFLPFALYHAIKGYRREGKGKRQTKDAPPHHSSPGPFELELFAAVWLITVFLFFSLSATRLPHYIGPLYPAAAILTALYWHRCLTDPATPGLRAAFHLLTGLGYLLGLTLVTSHALYATFVDTIAKEFPIAAQIDPGIGPPAAGVTLLIGMTLVRHFGLSEERRAGAFWAAGATIALVLLITIQVAVPRFNKYFISAPQELAYAAGLNLAPTDRLILYGSPKPSLVFYARRRAIVIQPGEEANLSRHLAQPGQQGRTMILLPTRLKAQLPAEAAGYPVILERYGYSLLANEPMVRGLPASPPVPRFGPHG